jgi:hypothetical protein
MNRGKKFHRKTIFLTDHSWFPDHATDAVATARKEVRKKSASGSGRMRRRFARLRHAQKAMMSAARTRERARSMPATGASAHWNGMIQK